MTGAPTGQARTSRRGVALVVVLATTLAGLVAADLALERGSAASGTRSLEEVLSPGAAAGARLPAISDSPTSGRSGADQRHALELLRRAATVGATVSFTGTQMVGAWTSGGTAADVVEVQHSPFSGTWVRRHGTPATGDSTGWAPTGTAAGGSLAVQPLEVLARSYDVTVAGSGSVAGREATVVEARKDAAVVARLYLDDRSGLMLRKEVLDSSGRLVREAAFLDLTVSPSPARPGTATATSSPSLSPMSGPPAQRVGIDLAGLAELREQGWECPPELPPGMVLYDARRGATADGEVLHLSYSDGISAVSLFQQRGSLDADGLSGYEPARVGSGLVHVSTGVPSTVVWQSGASVLTVVADTPAGVVPAVVRALPPPEPERTGVRARLGRGIEQLTGW